MRSLFHFPLPCTTTLAVTVSYSNRPTAPEMCHRPHPAPMRRQRRSPVLLSAARSHRAPSPEYRPAAARTHWARLVRIAPTACRRPHRIYPTACRHPHPPMSPPSRFRAHRPPSRPSCAAAVLYVLRFAVRIAPTVRRHPRHPLALRRPRGPGWQEPHRMHPFFAECAKKAPFLATSARNACFSRSRWQHPRPMHPFPGAIGRFGIHGARILPPRALFRVGEPEITHGAKMLPAPPGLSAAAACGPAERALRHATAACGTRHGRTGFAPCGAGLACLPHAPPAISPAFIAAVLHAPCFAVRDPPHGPRTDASRHLRAAPIPPATRTHRVQETSGTTQTTQCGHKNRIPKWGPY